MKVLCKKTKSIDNFIIYKSVWYDVLSEIKRAIRSSSPNGNFGHSARRAF